MANQFISKVIFGGEVKMDLTADTITPETVLAGKSFHDKSGAPLTGSCTFDSDTMDATAAEAEILAGQTAYVRGAKLTGTMPNRGGVELELSDKNQPVPIPQGFHDGSGSVSLVADDKAKLIPENVRQGVEILGVVGTMSGLEDVRARQATATPTTTEQLIVPGEGYTHLTGVKVLGIPYVETDNSAGGKTVTIG